MDNKEKLDSIWTELNSNKKLLFFVRKGVGSCFQDKPSENNNIVLHIPMGKVCDPLKVIVFPDYKTHSITVEISPKRFGLKNSGKYYMKNLNDGVKHFEEIGKVCISLINKRSFVENNLQVALMLAALCRQVTEETIEYVIKTKRNK